MAAALNFTDGTGAASLTSSYPAPANRFRNWTPFATAIGEGAHGLGDGKFYRFRFRTDYGASFELPGIANTDMDIILRLHAHLTAGGVVEVATGDANTATYTNCCLAPDAEMEIELEDSKMLDYVVRLTVINIDPSPVAMVCTY